MYNTGIAYILWVIGGFGVLGLHRFYLGKIPTGILWLCSGGLGGLGALYDLFTLSNQVRLANLKKGRVVIDSSQPATIYINGLPAGNAAAPARPTETMEKTILRVARANGGMVSPGEVALEGDCTIDQARKTLEAMAGKGLCEMKIRSSGVIVFMFTEFQSRGGNDFAVE